MLRKVAMFLAGAMICVPFGGDAQIALGKYVHVTEVTNPNASWWLSTGDIVLISACVLVLSLTASLRWR
jgi:hypothetical protein